jgi:hypothetical protein
VSDGVVKLESLMVVANVTALMDADLASAA